MNFGRWDIGIFVGMSIAIISMSFLFPPLGLTNEDINSTDIPEFNITKGTFDFADKKPNFPTRPSKGELRYVDNQSQDQDDRQIWLNGDSSDGVSIVITDDNSNVSNPQPEITLNEFTSTGSNFTTILINESEFKVIEDYGYRVAIENVNVSNKGQADMTITAEFEVLQQPSDTSWLGRVPVVGTVVGAGNQLAAIVGWIGSIGWHYVYNFIVLSSNLLHILYNVITFFIDFFLWLSTTYFSIVTGAGASWASVIVAIPGILLSFILLKAVIVFIHLLPTT